MIKLLLSFLAVIGIARQTFGANLIERDGRYEINWSTGKVRFYGVGQLAAADDSYRAAEQRAWADGLKAAELHIPSILANRLGAVEKIQIDKLSKLAASTVSVSTTYFGDNRVKVLLEAPIQKITPQLVRTSSNSGLTDSVGGTGLIIKLPKGTKPMAFMRILDEHGREMVSSNEVIANIHAGAPMAKWYKNNIDPGSGALPSESPIISGANPEIGVIRVNSSDWKPSYAAMIAQGTAAFVLH